MAELRRSGVGSRGTQGRPSSAARNGQVRRVSAKQGGPPRWLLITLLVVPVLGIIALLMVNANRGEKEEVAAPVKETVNVNDLAKQIPSLEKDCLEAQKLLRQESPLAQAKFEAIQKRLNDWVRKWDDLCADKKDADGNLLPDYEGYAPTRAKVNQLLSDLNKSAPF